MLDGGELNHLASNLDRDCRIVGRSRRVAVVPRHRRIDRLGNTNSTFDPPLTSFGKLDLEGVEATRSGRTEVRHVLAPVDMGLGRRGGPDADLDSVGGDGLVKAFPRLAVAAVGGLRIVVVAVLGIALANALLAAVELRAGVVIGARRPDRADRFVLALAVVAAVAGADVAIIAVSCAIVRRRWITCVATRGNRAPLACREAVPRRAFAVVGLVLAPHLGVTAVDGAGCAVVAVQCLSCLTTTRNALLSAVAGVAVGAVPVRLALNLCLAKAARANLIQGARVAIVARGQVRRVGGGAAERHVAGVDRARVAIIAGRLLADALPLVTGVVRGAEIAVTASAVGKRVQALVAEALVGSAGVAVVAARRGALRHFDRLLDALTRAADMQGLPWLAADEAVFLLVESRLTLPRAGVAGDIFAEPVVLAGHDGPSLNGTLARLADQRAVAEVAVVGAVGVLAALAAVIARLALASLAEVTGGASVAVVARALVKGCVNALLAGLVATIDGARVVVVADSRSRRADATRAHVVNTTRTLVARADVAVIALGAVGDVLGVALAILAPVLGARVVVAALEVRGALGLRRLAGVLRGAGVGRPRIGAASVVAGVGIERRSVGVDRRFVVLVAPCDQQHRRTCDDTRN